MFVKKGAVTIFYNQINIKLWKKNYEVKFNSGVVVSIGLGKARMVGKLEDHAVPDSFNGKRAYMIFAVFSVT